MKHRIIIILIIAIAFIDPAIAQKSGKKIIISGIVTDAGYKPIPGAMILVDNQRTRSITDTSGFYLVKVRPDVKAITIFSMSNGICVAPVNGRTKIDFILIGSGISQDTVKKNEEKDKTVDIGYGTMQKKHLSTPVDNIEGPNKRYTAYQNIYDMIRAEVPGIQVSGNNIMVRGPSSLNGKSVPLFVVEGNIVSSIDDVSPLNVKSIQILKGSSASIYGAKGSYGVILIHLFDGR